VKRDFEPRFETAINQTPQWIANAFFGRASPFTAVSPSTRTQRIRVPHHASPNLSNATVSSMIDADTSWRYLRSTRADPPLLVTDGARRNVYVAALEQSEQLWRASTSLNHETRPITLYYSLMQAGRSILAARAEGSAWRPPASHGLQPTSAQILQDQMPTLGDFQVHDHGDGTFQAIASMLGSPTLPEDATVAALISSLPESPVFIEGFRGGEPTPLDIAEDDGFDLRYSLENGFVPLWVSPVPDDLVPESMVVNPTEAGHGSAARLGDIQDGWPGGPAGRMFTCLSPIPRSSATMSCGWPATATRG
jgi:hypothetical protein